MSDKLTTPVALIVFRRPDLTAKVLEAVARVKPDKLLVVADTPRDDRPGERAACEQTRALIDQVDWECEVLTNYAVDNMGCALRVSSGLEWVFEQVEEAIILEDDCVPDISFFEFCTQMLELYRADERVMHISGCTYRPDVADTPYSYYFSRFPGCWGWATWRRAWKHYDLRVAHWEHLRKGTFLSRLINEPIVEAFWAKEFDGAMRSGDELHYWDFQWAFACWANSGLAVTPRGNLVTNVGDGEGATHTVSDSRIGLPVIPMRFPLSHPPLVLPDEEMDRRFVMAIRAAMTPRPDTRPLIRRVVSDLTPAAVKTTYRRVMKGKPA